MEQRSEIRLAQSHRVVIKTAAETPFGDAAEFVLANCLDVSSDGLKVDLSCPVNEGCIYEISVLTEQSDKPLPIIEQTQTYRLVAEVMWCQADTSDGGYQAGIKILNSEDTEFIHWKQRLLRDLKANS